MAVPTSPGYLPPLEKLRSGRACYFSTIPCAATIAFFASYPLFRENLDRGGAPPDAVRFLVSLFQPFSIFYLFLSSYYNYVFGGGEGNLRIIFHFFPTAIRHLPQPASDLSDWRESTR
ncbi:MAG: hypothetical protein LUG50_16005 [Planctomycetaceae bacterium]|nr:hypothetical protein [Planctomycetaceae bacterium]